MRPRRFVIKSREGELLYDPLRGIIQGNKGEKRIDSRNDESALFPHYPDGSERAVQRSFRPHCLTLYTTNECNLNCQYCYARGRSPSSRSFIDRRAVRAAAKFVAQCCQRDTVPFVLGFHGGNEPLLYPEIVRDCLEICAGVAGEHHLAFQSYCTTNGVQPAEVIQWAAKTFYGIRLSWDGPPDLHDRFRTLANGLPTSQIVEQSAQIILRQESSVRDFVVRATIGAPSVRRLGEIAKFFVEKGVRRVEMYPVFEDHRGSIPAALSPAQQDFVAHFLQAREWSRRHGMKLFYAGTRLGDLHDRHCHVLRGNLVVTPDGYLSSCFLATQHAESQCESSFYGRYDVEQDALVIDWARLGSILDRLRAKSEQCNTCFNFLHCAKGCPARCPIEDRERSLPPLDCTTEKWIGLSNILETAYGPPANGLANVQEYFSSIKVRMLSSQRRSSECLPPTRAKG